MQFLRTTGRGLADLVSGGTLRERVGHAFAEQLGYSAPEAEARSWERSLAALSSVLGETRLGDIEVLVEFQLPLSAKRIDALLIGHRPDGRLGALVVENKQWTAGEIEDVEARTVRVAGRLLTHPQQQVAGYVDYLRDFNALVERGDVVIDGCAFLHNATSAQVAGIRSAALPDVAQYPIFSADDLGRFRGFLGERFTDAPAGDAADRFVAGPWRASKKLLDHVEAQVHGQPAFTLLDEQRVAFDVAQQAVEDSRAGNTKTVVIVVGGPGTGKSVIAMELVAVLASQGRNITHATGSKSFTTTLRDRVDKKAASVFRYFNNFAHAPANELDVLIADEAHRIRITSNHRFTRKDKRSTIPQVDELIAAARVPVFLLDERQVVRPGEIGTVEAITDAAMRAGAEVIRVDLNAQFRCAGSDAYIRWVDELLEFDGTTPTAWVPDAFELTAVDSPQELEDWVHARADGTATARMTAGFCWPWSDPDGGLLVEDVVIGDWRRPWNAKPEIKVEGAPSASLWAADPRGIGQVGCIYTAQGFEFDCSGVILGPDFVRRGDRWVIDPSFSHDSVVKRSGDAFDELVRHTYKVLLTRGLAGCAIHSTDDETLEFLHALIPG